MLLCRLAESTFWLARYLERAEDLARALLVWQQLGLDMAGREAPTWQRLGPIAGIDADEADLLDPRAFVARVILDRQSASSLLGSLSRARENLRRARSLLPSECWHALNALYLRLEGLEPDLPPAELGASLAEVVASTQQLAGQVAAGMLRDESYAFLRMGIYLERGDMMLRIATTMAEALIPVDQPFRFEDVRWTGLLKSVGAYQAYRRRYHARADFARVIDLLLFEPAFPRSLAHAVQQIGREIEGLPKNAAPRAAVPAGAPAPGPTTRAGLLEFADAAIADLAHLGSVLDATYFTPPPAALRDTGDGVRLHAAAPGGQNRPHETPESGPDGRLYAINPENGFFGVAPGTNAKSNPNAIEAVASDTIFTNVALTDDGDVWWDGMTDVAPAHLIDWRGKDWTPASGVPAAHPNSRFTTPLTRCPSLDEHWDNPRGVPIAAFVFGGRMTRDMPLVYQAFNWSHGVYSAATMGSEATAAAEAGLPPLRRDPMAMLPFCGYNMADYFSHWLDLGRKIPNPPRIFRVNWFRRGADGKFLWPGFSENLRVLAWIVDRIHGRAFALESPLGWMPRYEDLEWRGLDYSETSFRQLMGIDREAAASEVRQHEEMFDKFLDRLPKEFILERELLRLRLWRSPEHWELAREIHD